MKNRGSKQLQQTYQWEKLQRMEISYWHRADLTPKNRDVGDYASPSMEIQHWFQVNLQGKERCRRKHGALQGQTSSSGRLPTTWGHLHWDLCTSGETIHNTFISCCCYTSRPLGGIVGRGHRLPERTYRWQNLYGPTSGVWSCRGNSSWCKINLVLRMGRSANLFVRSRRASTIWNN